MAGMPRGGFGAELGVGGSLRRAEGLGTSRLFGHALGAPPSPPRMQPYGSVGPTPGKAAFTAGSHNVMPHLRHWS